VFKIPARKPAPGGNPGMDRTAPAFGPARAERAVLALS